MTRANTEQTKFVPWFAKAGAACSIVPIARFIGPSIFALKGGGYGCLVHLSGIDEEGLTDQELESRMRSIEGALRGLPEGSCLYQYTRVMSGYELPRQQSYSNPVTQVFVDDRLGFLEKTAAFRRIDLHWCLTLEPPKLKAFERKPQENSADTSRMLVELQKAATIPRTRRTWIPNTSTSSRHALGRRSFRTCTWMACASCSSSGQQDRAKA
jgi:type IV secretion system protein VirB4